MSEAAMGIGTKVAIWPHVAACLAVRGTQRHGSLIESELTRHGDSFDAMVSHGPNLAVRAAEACTGSPHGNHFDMVLAGWSEARAAFEAYQLTWRDEPRPAEWTHSRLPSSISPYDENIAAELSRNGIRPGAGSPALRDCGRIVTAAQRAVPTLSPVTTAKPSGTMVRTVGVFCQMTVVRRDGIRTEIIERWPADRIGARIGEVSAGD